MTRCLVPFAHAGPADFCKRRVTSYGAAIGQKLLFVNGLSPKSAATGVRIASEMTDRRAWLSSNAAFTASLATWLEVTALIADRVKAQLLVTIKQRLL